MAAVMLAEEDPSPTLVNLLKIGTLKKKIERSGAERFCYHEVTVKFQ